MGGTFHTENKVKKTGWWSDEPLPKNCLNGLRLRNKVIFQSNILCLAINIMRNDEKKVHYINKKKVNRGCVLGNAFTFLPVESDKHLHTHIQRVIPVSSWVLTWGLPVRSGWYFITQPSHPQTARRHIIQLLPYWFPCGAALLHCSWE